MDVSWLSLAPISICNPKLFALLFANNPKGGNPYTGTSPQHMEKEDLYVARTDLTGHSGQAECVWRSQLPHRHFKASFLLPIPLPACPHLTLDGGSTVRGVTPPHPPSRAGVSRDTGKPFGQRKRKPLLAHSWSHITFSF